MRLNFYLSRPASPSAERSDQECYKEELLLRIDECDHDCTDFCPCSQLGTQIPSLLPRLFRSGSGPCRIVCFGLGPLEDTGVGQRSPAFNQAAIQRHVIAGHIAGRLQKLAASEAARNGVAPGEIELVFDDPAYTARDWSLIKQCMPVFFNPKGPVIHILRVTPTLGLPQGYCDINSNTLVLAVRPAFPVRQLVMEMCTPAAMLWSDHGFDGPPETAHDIESFYLGLRPDEHAGPATGGNLHRLLVPGTPM